MTTTTRKTLILAALLALAPCTASWAQSVVIAQNAQPAPEATPAANAVTTKFDKAINNDENWYFSWGYSRQQYAPSDIRVSQPELGNDFTIRKAKGSDFPSSVGDTISSLFNLDFTNPQENIRIGKFLNPEKTFAVELNIDHSKYNVDYGQTVAVDGTINNAAAPSTLAITPQNFNYALHNGLNHIMINAVWLHRLRGPEQKPGDLQLISRVGAGILLPHADNIIFGNANEVGPKNENVCCFKKNDWWQINGWTAGVEVGLRYRVYKSMYVELTNKIAYGVLRGVPVYKGTADQELWMNEQVLSAGFLF
jgi:hypothetical protein